MTTGAIGQSLSDEWADGARHWETVVEHIAYRFGSICRVIAVCTVDDARLVPYGVPGRSLQEHQLFAIAEHGSDAAWALLDGGTITPIDHDDPDLPDDLRLAAVRFANRLVGAVVVLGSSLDEERGAPELLNVANDVGPLLANAMAFASQRRAAADARLGAEVIAALSSSTQLPRVLTVAARNAALATGFERASVLMRAPSGRFIAAASQFADNRADTRLWGALRVIDRPIPAVLDSLRTGLPEAFEHPEREQRLLPAGWVEPLGIKSAMVLPLLAQDEQLGAVLLDSCVRRRVTTDDLRSGQLIGHQIALAVSLAQLIEQERSGHRRSQLVLATVVQAATQLNTTGVLAIIAEGVRELLDDTATTAFVMEDGRPGRLVVRGWGDGAIDILDALMDDARFPDGGSPLRTGRSLPLEIDPEFTDSDALKGLGFTRMLLIPVQRASTELGWVVTWHDRQKQYEDRDVRVVGAPAAQAALSLHTARLLERERATVARLEDLDKLKTSFVAAVSHELRTPLTAIVGFAELLGEAATNPTDKEFIENIRREAALLESLISNLLDTSRLEAGMLTLHRIPVDVVNLIDESIDVVRHGYKGRPIALDPAPDLPTAMLDSVRMRQVFINLIENAAKYSPSDAKIEVRCVAEGEDIVVTVDDQGPGIDPDQREAVFQRFHRLAIDGAKPGTGIGLYLVRELVNAHGGSVLVTDRPGGRGARFVVRVPIAEPEEADESSGND